MRGNAVAPSEGAAPNPLLGADEVAPARGGLGPGRVLEIQRARILAAMVEECAERGVGNVSVAHVVARAGVSRRTFYEIFEDREECFLGAFDDAVARASRYVLDAYDSQAKWVERVRAALTAVLQFIDVERYAGQLLIVGSLGAGPQALDRRRRVVAQAIAFVDEGRALTGSGGSTKGAAKLQPLTAEGIVGGVLSVLHSRLLVPRDGGLDIPPAPLVTLASPLMSMIVLPYLGPAAARKELARPAPRATLRAALGPPYSGTGDPLRDLGMRLTYRTVRVLIAVAATPGGSNRQVADGAGIGDQGQISKLLARLHGLGLIENTGPPAMRGAPNSWVLTDKGWEVQGALSRNTT